MAGDAARIHSPAGGRGLNHGLGDAAALGRLLPPVLRGVAPVESLDVYDAERRPLGNAILDWTRAQSALGRPDVSARALRRVVAELLDSKPATTYVLRRIRAARTTPGLDRIALYEPPLSVNGSVPIRWLARYEHELARGAVAAAVVTAMKGMLVVPLFVWLPRLVAEPMLSLVMRAQGDGNPEDVSIRALASTLSYDVQIVKEMSDTLGHYANLPERVLLLGGTKSPPFLRLSLDALEHALPHVERITFAGLGHDGPEDDGKPNLLARASCIGSLVRTAT
jgi:hypothetical protein